MKKAKQISYLSALIIIIGSTIGAGIFFKNGELSQQAHGNMWLVLSSWTVAGVGMLALGLAMVEISSASKNNGGTLELIKNFMPKWAAKAGKSYVQLLFIPITLVTVPIYVVETWQYAGMSTSSWGAWAMGLGVFLWISLISFISLKASERTQWVLTFFKFIPLIILPTIALCNAGNVDIFHKDYGEAIGGTAVNTHDVHPTKGLLGVTPGIVLIGGIPAISFAFDGFYKITALRNNLEEPKKLGSIIVVGVSSILAIYLGITIAFAIGSKDGTVKGIDVNPELIRALNVFLGIGVIGIANGAMMGSVEQNAILHEHGDSPITYYMSLPLNYINKKLFKRKENISFRKLSWIYVTVITIFFFIVFGLIGIYGWEKDDLYETLSAGTLYNFIDTLVNYTSSLMFGLITLAVLGGVFNRFTKKIKVDKFKWFIPASIISLLILIPGILFQFITGIVNSFGYNGASIGESLVELCIFGVILGTSIISGILEIKFWDETKYRKIIKNSEIKLEN